MNSFSLIKFYTLVGFFVVSGFSVRGTAADAVVPTANPAAAAPAAQPLFGSVDPVDSKQKEVDNICKSDNKLKARGFRNEDQCSACIYDPSGDDCPSQSRKNCNDSYDDYKKSLDDASSACDALVGAGSTRSSTSKSVTSNTKKCSERIADCRKMITKTNPYTAASDPDRESSFALQFTQIGLQALNQANATNGTQTDPATAAANAEVTCIGDVQTTKATSLRDKIDTKITKLRDDLDKLNKEAIKDDADLKKEQKRITDALNKLNKGSDESNRNIDKESREKATAAANATVDAIKRIRDINTQITKKNTELRTLQFNYQQQQVSQSAEKIQRSCNQALTAARNCMIKSTKSTFTEEDRKTCPPSAILENKKGVKAKAELQGKLKDLETDCYEQANLASKSSAFSQQERITDINQTLTELQKQLADEQQKQQIAADDNQKIADEAQRAKDEGAQELAKEVAATNQELADITQNASAKVTYAKQRSADIQKQIDDLLFKLRTGSESNITQAESIVKKTNILANDVWKACGCDKAENKIAIINCTKVEKNNPDTDPKTRKWTPSKTTQ